MPHTTIRFASLSGAVAALVLAGSGGTAVAQTPPAPTWLRVDTVQVKPELWAEYRDIERDEVIPALRKAGVPYRAAWRTAEFGATYELILVRPIPDFAEYDSGDSFSKALAPREAERLRARLRRCLVGRDSAALLQRTDLSVGQSGRPFSVVTTLTVAPGRGLDYEAFLRETLPEIKNAGIVLGVYQRVYGQAAWVLVQNLDSLKELAQPRAIIQAFGQEGGDRVISRLSGIVTAVERKVLRFDPELSFSPPGAADTGR